jgi:hypothetical protein
LWDNNKELTQTVLHKIEEKWDFESLEYRNLCEGKITPVHSIGSKFVVFDSNIQNIESIELSGVQLIPIVNKSTLHKYYLMNAYEWVDCVDWEKSEVDKWNADSVLQSYHNPRGRFFINPVLSREKITGDLEAFRLKEWSDAYNIVVSEQLKEKICSLDFDKSFLVFKPLEIY